MGNKKAFTLLELLAVIVILGILVVLAVAKVTDIIETAKTKTYKSNEAVIIKATQTYLTFNEDKIPKTPNDISYIDINELQEKDFLNEIKDDKGLCTGYIVITTNENNEIKYAPYINCEEYKTYEDYIQEGLVLHIDGYDEAEESKVTDRSSYENDVTIASYDPDEFYDNENKRFNFYQEAGYLFIENNENINFESSFTIEIIFNTGNEYTGYAYHPINKWTSTSDANFVLYHFGNYHNELPGNSGKFVIYATADNVWQSITPWTILEWDKRYHATLTFDKEVGGKTYINNQLQGIYTNAKDKNLYLNWANLKIDFYNYDNENKYLYVLRIYNRALTEEEINYNYNIDKQRFGLD